MKVTNNAVLSCFALLLLLNSCASKKTPSETASSGTAHDFNRLTTKSGILRDVNNGVELGTYDIKIRASEFTLYIETEETKGITAFDGVKTFSPFQNLFEGIIEKQKDGSFLLYGDDETNTYYVIIHDLAKDLLPKNLSDLPHSEAISLLSVMDKSIFEEVFLQKKVPYAFAIHSLKPFMRTHALILE